MASVNQDPQEAALVRSYAAHRDHLQLQQPRRNSASSTSPVVGLPVGGIDSDSDVKVVIDGAAVALRRQNADSKICSIPECQNDEMQSCLAYQVDGRGLMTVVECSKCKELLPVRCHQSKRYWERVDDAAELHVGDHIFWHRLGGWFHHAIVTSVTKPDHENPNAKLQISVVEYDISRDKPCLELQETKFENQRSCGAWCSGSLYRMKYGDSYTNDYVRLRAQTWVGQRKYNLMNRNCEHASHWCKTGRRESGQIRSCLTSMGKVSLNIILRLLGLLVLWVVQIVHEYHEEAIMDTERIRLKRFEQFLNLSYILLIALVFMGYFIWKQIDTLKPKIEKKQREDRVTFNSATGALVTTGQDLGEPSLCCTAESCANDAYKKCTSDCCGDGCKKFCRCLCCCCVCTPLCLWGVLCLPIKKCCQCLQQVFCCRCCQYCCRRPSSDVYRICIRVCVREIVAATGPFLVTWFEEKIEQNISPYIWPTLLFQLFLLLVVGAVFYAIGQFVGSLMEELFELFRKLFCWKKEDRWKDRLVKVPV